MPIIAFAPAADFDTPVSGVRYLTNFANISYHDSAVRANLGAGDWLPFNGHNSGGSDYIGTCIGANCRNSAPVVATQGPGTVDVNLLAGFTGGVPTSYTTTRGTISGSTLTLSLVDVFTGNVTITASNAGGTSGPVTLSLTINPAFAVVTITAFGPQPAPNGDVPVTYTIDVDATCKMVIYASTEAKPTAAQMLGGGVYTSLPDTLLTATGTSINAILPNGLNGLYKIAIMPAGAGDANVVESTATTINTIVVGGITPVFVSGAVTGTTSLALTETLTLDMSTHNTTNQTVVMVGSFVGNVGSVLSGVDFDGKSPTAITTVPPAGLDGITLAYATFAPASFAASSIMTLTFSQQVYDAGVAVYNIPPGATVATLTSQPETTRAGSDVSGNVSAGDGVIAVQQASNGIAASWTTLTEDFESDIRVNEWFTSASAGNVVAADTAHNYCNRNKRKNSSYFCKGLLMANLVFTPAAANPVSTVTVARLPENPLVGEAVKLSD
ncbi:MAG: hypothetical protein U5K75_12100 [Ahrensia sp.]|nr:hypothetical protein [Ahrensia sp.]